MASDQGPEKLKLVLDPQDRDILGARERTIEPKFEPGSATDAEPGRRAEGASPELDPLDEHAQAPRGRAVSVIVAVMASAHSCHFFDTGRAGRKCSHQSCLPGRLYGVLRSSAPGGGHHAGTNWNPEGLLVPDPSRE